jgi:hypothetical protein
MDRAYAMVDGGTGRARGSLRAQAVEMVGVPFEGAA